MIVLASVVLIGAASQRVAGIGFAMIVAPFAVLVVSPMDSLAVVCILGSAAGALVLASTFRSVDWRLVLLLLPTSVLGVAVGAVTASSLPESWLSVAVGAGLIVAIVASILVARADRIVRGGPVTVTAGFASGLLSSMAGVGGPPMTVLAVLTRHEPRSFSASMQPYVIALSVLALGSRLLIDPDAAITLNATEWIVLAACTIAGIGAGTLLAHRLPAAGVRWIVIALGLLGAVLALVHGIAGVASAG